MLFIFLPCLIALAKISSFMLNERGESQHLCLILSLSVNAFSLSLLNVILAIGVFINSFYEVEKLSFIPNILRFFIMNWFDFTKYFLCQSI